MRSTERIAITISLAICLAAAPARAIQLRWMSGGAELTFTTSARCTLVVQADDVETSLPKVWTLLWVADTSAIEQIAIQGADSCGLGLAHPATLVQPSNSLDVLSNRQTLSFCSLGSGLVYIAHYIVDLPAGSRGKFKVVGIDRTDPNASRVIQSPVATFNGGIADAFPAAILRTETEHQSTEYRIRVIGAGFQAVQEATLKASDESWEVPLTMTTVSDTELRATAELAAWVPECSIVLNTSSAEVTAERVSADPPPPPLDPAAACQARFIEDIYPPAMIQPKDFAFVPGGWTPEGSWTFHLFYIRQNQVIRNKPGGPALTEKNLGHAVSNSLEAWTVLDTAAISVRPGRWDSFHVWAPTVVRKGVTYYMFYTGVDGTGKQSIGLATSTDLIHWEQGDSVLTRGNAGSWVDQTSNDLRDPLVMEDPDAPGQWLMYFTSRTTEYPGMAAGSCALRMCHFRQERDCRAAHYGGRSRIAKAASSRLTSSAARASGGCSSPSRSPPRTQSMRSAMRPVRAIL